MSYRKCSRWKTLLIPPLIHSYCLLSNAFIRPLYIFRIDLNRGILVWFCHGKSNNHRILQQLVFHKQESIKTTSVQDLDPSPSSVKNRNLKRRLICECRYDERLKAKTEGSTRLTYTVFRGGLEHLKIETKLINQRFASVMGECGIWTSQVCRRYSK